MSQVFRNLSLSSYEGTDIYQKQYMSSIKDIYSVLSNPRLLKSHISTKNFSEVNSLLRFSLVFNDLSLFTCTGGDKLSITMLDNNWFQQNFNVPGASLSISEDKLERLGLDPKNLNIIPAFTFPHDENVASLLKELSPFIERGKLLLQPDRALLYVQDANNKHGTRTWSTIDTSQFTPLEHWEITDEHNSRPLPISFESSNDTNQKAMFDITIPYLEGVNFSDLSKILEDEGDLVSSLRKSIKEAISECKDDADPYIVARDVIDPKIDALNRKFKSTVNSHAFRVAGASVGTVVLAYTAVATSGLSSIISTVCGSGGLGLLGKEYSTYKEKMNNLKDDPYYFLWRCKNGAKKT